MDRQSVDFPAGLQPNVTPGAQILNVAPLTWRLCIPAGPADSYRLAQLDDYSGLSRRSFRWQAGFRLSLEARASHPNLWHWGFGVWNDPFSMGILNRAGKGRRTTLRACQRFQIAPGFLRLAADYLSLRDDLPPRVGWRLLSCDKCTVSSPGAGYFGVSAAFPSRAENSTPGTEEVSLTGYRLAGARSAR
jgi:hypothetical protein